METNQPKVQSCQALVAEAVSLFHELKSLTQKVHGEDEATAARRGVMRSLMLDGPRTVPQLARNRKVTRQSIQQVVNQLKERGLVSTETNQDHRRSHLVTPTQEGKAWYDDLMTREAEYLSALSLPLATEEIWKLVFGLKRMREFFAALPPGQTPDL
ncbi:MAG: MarR family transcriptional regulator [bacterium]|nr:MarR family transcriptional regulator [bacterium]